MALTDQKKRFADKYFETLKGRASAIYAGYSEKTAGQIAYNLLQEPEVEEYIAKLKEEMSIKHGINRDWIIDRFKAISDRCVQAEPVMIPDGEGGWIEESGEYKFDSNGANSATANLGKIFGVFEKDNDQSKPKTTNIISLGSGAKPDDTSSEAE